MSLLLRAQNNKLKREIRAAGRDPCKILPQILRATLRGLLGHSVWLFYVCLVRFYGIFGFSTLNSFESDLRWVWLKFELHGKYQT